MLAARTCADARHWFESKNWRPTGWHLISLAAHAHTQASTHASMHTRTNARTRSRTLVLMCAHACVHACTPRCANITIPSSSATLVGWPTFRWHIRTHARARKHAHARTHTHAQACTRARAHVPMHTCTCTCSRVHTNAISRTHMQMGARAHTHTCSPQVAANQQCALTQAARGSAAYGCSDTMKRWDFGWLVGPLS